MTFDKSYQIGKTRKTALNPHFRDRRSEGGGQDQDGAKDDQDAVERDPSDGSVSPPQPGQAVRGAGDQDQALLRHAARPGWGPLPQGLPVR